MDIYIYIFSILHIDISMIAIVEGMNCQSLLRHSADCMATVDSPIAKGHSAGQCHWGNSGDMRWLVFNSLGLCAETFRNIIAFREVHSESLFYEWKIVKPASMLGAGLVIAFAQWIYLESESWMSYYIAQKISMYNYLSRCMINQVIKTWMKHNSSLEVTSIRACIMSLARSKLRLCSANHRAGYFSNLACGWLSIVWA